MTTTIKEKRIALIGESWYKQLGSEFDKPYFRKLSSWLYKRRRETFAVVYPKIEDTFKAFLLTSYEDVKVIIIGQDPYFNGTAVGVAFGIDYEKSHCPVSLQNIWTELENDVQFGLYLDFDYSLKSYTDQGVLLLNRVLTVEKGKPDSHAFIGWETFTDAVIHRLNKRNEKLVFMLWGSIARKIKPLIDEKHLVLEASHPAARNGGFFGCKHFSKANEFLKTNNQETIKW